MDHVTTFYSQFDSWIWVKHLSYMPWYLPRSIIVKEMWFMENMSIILRKTKDSTKFFYVTTKYSPRMAT